MMHLGQLSSRTLSKEVTVKPTLFGVKGVCVSSF